MDDIGVVCVAKRTSSRWSGIGAEWQVPSAAISGQNLMAGTESGAGRRMTDHVAGQHEHDDMLDLFELVGHRLFLRRTSSFALRAFPQQRRSSDEEAGMERVLTGKERKLRRQWRAVIRLGKRVFQTSAGPSSRHAAAHLLIALVLP